MKCCVRDLFVNWLIGMFSCVEALKILLINFVVIDNELRQFPLKINSIYVLGKNHSINVGKKDIVAFHKSNQVNAHRYEK